MTHLRRIQLVPPIILPILLSLMLTVSCAGPRVVIIQDTAWAAIDEFDSQSYREIAREMGGALRRETVPVDVEFERLQTSFDKDDIIFLTPLLYSRYQDRVDETAIRTFTRDTDSLFSAWVDAGKAAGDWVAQNSNRRVFLLENLDDTGAKAFLEGFGADVRSYRVQNPARLASEVRNALRSLEREGETLVVVTTDGPALEIVMGDTQPLLLGPRIHLSGYPKDRIFGSIGRSLSPQAVVIYSFNAS